MFLCHHNGEQSHDEVHLYQRKALVEGRKKYRMKTPSMKEIKMMS